MNVRFCWRYEPDFLSFFALRTALVPPPLPPMRHESAKSLYACSLAGADSLTRAPAGLIDVANKCPEPAVTHTEHIDAFREAVLKATDLEPSAAPLYACAAAPTPCSSSTLPSPHSRTRSSADLQRLAQQGSGKTRLVLVSPSVQPLARPWAIPLSRDLAVKAHQIATSYHFVSIKERHPFTLHEHQIAIPLLLMSNKQQ